MTLVEIADMTASLLSVDDVTAGTIDTAKEQTVGVYQREPFRKRQCIGSTESFQVFKARLLIRWGNSPTTAESKANQLADYIRALSDYTATSSVINFTQNVDVKAIGKDEKGICEYIIDADFIYTERVI